MKRPNQELLLKSTRRDFLANVTAGTTALTLGINCGRAKAAEEAVKLKVAFFVVGDTHYLANKEKPSRMDPRFGRNL